MGRSSLNLEGKVFINGEFVTCNQVTNQGLSGVASNLVGKVSRITHIAFVRTLMTSLSEITIGSLADSPYHLGYGLIGSVFPNAAGGPLVSAILSDINRATFSIEFPVADTEYDADGQPSLYSAALWGAVLIGNGNNYQGYYQVVNNVPVRNYMFNCEGAYCLAAVNFPTQIVKYKTDPLTFQWDITLNA